MEPFSQGAVRGFLHRPSGQKWDAGVVLAHGAGANAKAPILVKGCQAFAERGCLALRIDLPFRQARPSGPPHPSTAAKDQAGIREAIQVLRGLGAAKIIAGGHSYGGRQCSMLAAADPSVADLLLLLSYPLHPPDKPDALRVGHFGTLGAPAVFIHGVRDPFGTIPEMQSALALLPRPAQLLEVAGSGHELKRLDWTSVCEKVLEELGLAR